MHSLSPDLGPLRFTGLGWVILLLTETTNSPSSLSWGQLQVPSRDREWRKRGLGPETQGKADNGKALEWSPGGEMSKGWSTTACRSVNHSLQVSQPPVYVNKALLKHSHTHSFQQCPWLLLATRGRVGQLWWRPRGPQAWNIYHLAL